MQTILQGLRDLDGVHGTFVADATGQVLAFNAESIYDASLLQQVSKAIATAIDSVKLLEEHWCAAFPTSVDRNPKHLLCR